MKVLMYLIVGIVNFYMLATGGFHIIGPAILFLLLVVVMASKSVNLKRNKREK